MRLQLAANNSADAADLDYVAVVLTTSQARTRPRPKCAIELANDGTTSRRTAAVGDRRGVGVEQANKGIDVLGFPCLLKSLTIPACRAVAAAGACDGRMRRRTEVAGCRQAAGVRPTISATSVK